MRFIGSRSFDPCSFLVVDLNGDCVKLRRTSVDQDQTFAEVCSSRHTTWCFIWRCHAHIFVKNFRGGSNFF